MKKKVLISSIIPAIIFALISGSIYYIMFQNIDTRYEQQTDNQLEQIDRIKETLDEMIEYQQEKLEELSDRTPDELDAIKAEFAKEQKVFESNTTDMEQRIEILKDERDLGKQRLIRMSAIVIPTGTVLTFFICFLLILLAKRFLVPLIRKNRLNLSTVLIILSIIALLLGLFLLATGEMSYAIFFAVVFTGLIISGAVLSRNNKPEYINE